MLHSAQTFVSLCGAKFVLGKTSAASVVVERSLGVAQRGGRDVPERGQEKALDS